MPEKQKGILNKIKNLYSKADMYADGVSLTINEETASRSVIGATITLLVFATTIYMSSETMLNSVLLRNPTISLDSEQGNENITDLTFQNFFMAFSFFTPKSFDRKTFSNDTNDFEITSTMSTFKGDCLSNCSNYTFLMGHCNKSIFNNITALKDLPYTNSNNITDIFKTYSFCLPDQFQANLLDNDKKADNFISSFSIFIPDTYNQVQTKTQTQTNLRNLDLGNKNLLLIKI